VVSATDSYSRILGFIDQQGAAPRRTKFKVMMKSNPVPWIAYAVLLLASVTYQEGGQEKCLCKGRYLGKGVLLFYNTRICIRYLRKNTGRF
jgi:hypothetical protein